MICSDCITPPAVTWSPFSPWYKLTHVPDTQQALNVRAAPRRARCPDKYWQSRATLTHRPGPLDTEETTCIFFSDHKVLHDAWGVNCNHELEELAPLALSEAQPLHPWGDQSDSSSRMERSEQDAAHQQLAVSVDGRPPSPYKAGSLHRKAATSSRTVSVNAGLPSDNPDC